MKKALTNKYTESVTVIERADWSVTFYDAETGRHYTRRVWYTVSGSDIYVQHRGGFYSIATEFEGRYNPQAISRYDVATPEELEAMTAEIIAHRAGKQHADDLTWEEITRVYAYAIICRDADANATMTAVVNGILQDSSSQPETTASDREQVAEILASIEDPATRAYYAAEVSESGWSAEELTEAIQYRRDIIAANRAALALLDAYAVVIGEYPEEYDPESIAAYRVARDEIAGSHIRATAEELEIVADMVEAIAEDVRDLAAVRLEYATRPADLTAYQSEFCTFEPTREIYQRYELEAYLGDYTDDYDLEAIEAEATEYDPKTSRTYWKRDVDLWSVCERHELAAYYPAAI